ncbi:iron complex outermembrane recepter protein [Catalinimonas alkaloidigena]|uniref:Iron complex outermembrane recepter protein n=1 Tax=Catalinimonas alkaloidigena TaxID=1075417 RepID=A0A1G9IYP7_9BACT|nr:TonB-dependent receptor [Catalinimonas alkaloidigena]SDL30205.1 iron complex outermembrane recepter protein [Catalinimonas alkaloidigena]
MRNAYPFLLSLAALFPTSLLAQQANDTTVTLPEVTVLENRLQLPFRETSRNISIISAQELQQTPAQSIPEILSYTPGVDIRQRGPLGAQADLSIRGGTFDQTLVLINGVKVSDPQTGHHLLSLPLNLDNVAQIQVLKGPGARLFGQNAFTGAVNIITRVPDEKALYVSGYAGGFGPYTNLIKVYDKSALILLFGPFSYGGSVSLSLPTGPYKQYISVSQDASGGYQPNSDYRNSNVFYQAELDATGGKWNVLGGFSDRKLGANGYYSPSFPDQWEAIKTGLASVDYTYERGNWFVRPRVYWRYNQDEFRLRRNEPQFYRNHHLTHVLGAEINSRYVNRFGTTGFGVETRRESIVSHNNSGWALGEHDRYQLGIYAEHLFRFFGRLDVTPGVYVNGYSDWGWNAFPGLDAGLLLTPHLRLYANAGTAYRIPTYTDLYYVDRTSGSNPNLLPEKAFSYEGGLRYLNSTLGLTAEANVFRRNATDFIERVQLKPARYQENPDLFDPNDTLFVPVNFLGVSTQGLELSASLDGKALNLPVLDRFSVSYNYLQSDLSKQIDTSLYVSRYVLDQLRHQFIFKLDHQIYRNLTHHFRARWVERVNRPAYWVLDSRVMWTHRQVRLFAEMTNLTDTHYVESGWVQMPGRWLRLGLNWKINLERE